MKKFFYSGWMRALLIILILITGSLAADNTFRKIDVIESQPDVYDFDRSFEESRYFTYSLSVPVYAVSECLKGGGVKEGEDYITASERIIGERLSSGNIEYLVIINGNAFSNCGVLSADSFRLEGIYSTFRHTADGEVCSFSYNTGIPSGLYFDDYFSDCSDEVEIYSRVSDAAYEEYEYIWKEQERIIRETIIYLAVSALIILALLCLMVVSARKKKYSEDEEGFFDGMFTEVLIILPSAVIMYALYLCIVILEAYYDRSLPLYLARMGIAGSVSAGLLVFSLCINALIGNIKRKLFFKGSLIFNFFRLMLGLMKKFIKWVFSLVRQWIGGVKRIITDKSALYTTLGFLAYTLIIGAFGIVAAENGIGIIIAGFVFLLGCLDITRRGMETDIIRDAVKEIAEGDYSRKICGVKDADLKELAGDINKIGEGLDEAVAARVRAEKMKTELITNVSHDLKTPLTSIINYASLLSEMENLPGEAEDYIKIISMKGERLKNLTADLFEISKIQSGNEKTELEKVDISLLLNQALGENDREISDSGIVFVTDIEKEIFVLGDGKKLSRVINNLISNALKYTMKNTRVFITVSREYDNAVIEFKNVASYTMNFNGEDIVERFVRGDESRTGEGSGLGLAIARSYTEACGGRLNVTVDGDVFSVRIALPLEDYEKSLFD